MSATREPEGSPDLEPASVAAGRDDRLRRLLDEHGAFIRRTVARRCPRHLGIDPAEVEQDVRVRLWHALERESELRAPASFLYRVVATALIDAVRRRRARPEDQLMLEREDPAASAREPRDPTPGPELMARHAELLRVLEEELRSMQERRRLAVRLHLQGFDTREVGRLLGWTEPKARNLVYRGLGELRDRLLARGFDYQNEGLP